MKQEKLLTVREVGLELGITDQEVIDLAEQGKILAYKIGGVYLRFKPEQIQEVKLKISTPLKEKVKVSLSDRLRDFLYFNDFYILATLILIVMLIIIFRT